MKRIVIALLLVLITVFSLNACGPTESPTPETFTVTLAESEYYSIKSEATVTVEKGGTATFTVSPKDGYGLSSTNANISYEKNKVKVTNVQSDMTVTLDASQYYTVDATSTNTSFGTVTASASGNLDVGTPVTVTATAKEGYRFICWSLDKPVANGAEIHSYDATLNFEATKNLSLFANFASNDKFHVIYELNGGNMTTSKYQHRFTELLYADPTGCTNLAGNIGSFEYDGYNFLEFNTEPDGSGLSIPAGGIVQIPESGNLTVYAQWAEWTDPTKFETEILPDGTLAITNFKNKRFKVETLSIPAKIDGRVVTQISKLAIVGDGSSDTVKTLIIPRTIKTIVEEGICYLGKLDTLYVHDNLENVSDASFKNCKKFSNLRITAGVAPRHVAGATIGTRLKVLLANKNLDKPIIMLVAGSSTWYGYDSVYLEQLLDNKYFVLNCGTNASCSGFFYMEGLSPYLREGDYILNAPEYGHNQYAGYEINERHLLYSETAYNVYWNVDFSKYHGFFDALGKWNTKDANDPNDLYRFDNPARNYDVPNGSLTYPNCDNATLRVYDADKVSKAPLPLDLAVLTDERVERFNWIYNYMKDKGITYLYSCAPIFGYNPPGEDLLNAYYNLCVEKLECDVVSNPNDHIYDVTLYNADNNNYHHNTEGAHERAGRVAIDLRRYFGMDEE